MPDLFRLLGGDFGSALKYIAIFFALPYLYFRHCIEMHRRDEFRQVCKRIRDGGEVGEDLRGRIEAFELDGWLVAAFAFVLMGVSLAGNLAYVSESFGDLPGPTESIEGVRVGLDGTSWRLWLGVEPLQGGKKFDPREQVVAIMNAFALFLGLLAILWIMWSERGMYRALARERVDLA